MLASRKIGLFKKHTDTRQITLCIRFYYQLQVQGIIFGIQKFNMYSNTISTGASRRFRNLIQHRTIQSIQLPVYYKDNISFHSSLHFERTRSSSSDSYTIYKKSTCPLFSWKGSLPYTNFLLLRSVMLYKVSFNTSQIVYNVDIYYTRICVIIKRFIKFDVILTVHRR